MSSGSHFSCRPRDGKDPELTEGLQEDLCRAELQRRKRHQEAEGHEEDSGGGT